MQKVGKLLAAFAAGSLFALGLAVSGMTQPAKVLGFLNLAGLLDPGRFGAWDPSLAFVMGGAVSVTLLAFARSAPAAENAARRPWFMPRFAIPARQAIDRPLLLGAALFGIGWGLTGYCPGPAFASLLTGGLDLAVFVAAVLIGMALARRLAR